MLAAQLSMWSQISHGMLMGFISLAWGISITLPTIYFHNWLSNHNVTHWKRRWYHRFSYARRLSFMDGGRANFAGKNLKDMRLTWCTFSEADFARADLSDAILTHVRFDNTDLSGVSFRGANLQGTAFTKCNLDGADLRGANLTDCRFRESHLEGANLRDADLGCASFMDASLSDADVTGARLFEVDLFKARLRGVRGLHTTSDYLSARSADWAELPDGWQAVNQVLHPGWIPEIEEMFSANSIYPDLAQRLVRDYAGTATITELVEMAKNLQQLEGSAYS